MVKTRTVEMQTPEGYEFKKKGLPTDKHTRKQ